MCRRIRTGKNGREHALRDARKQAALAFSPPMFSQRKGEVSASRSLISVETLDLCQRKDWCPGWESNPLGGLILRKLLIL